MGSDDEDDEDDEDDDDEEGVNDDDGRSMVAVSRLGMSTPLTRKKEKDVKSWQYASQTARWFPPLYPSPLPPFCLLLLPSLLAPKRCAACCCSGSAPPRMTLQRRQAE